MVPLSASPAATMPQASEPGRAEPGGSTPITRRSSGGASGDARRLDHRARPQRVGAILDDFAIDLLAPKPGAGVTGQHLVEKCRRQMRGIGMRGRPRDGRARIGEQPLDQRDRPRRGGDELARPQAKTQPELQHVECRIDIAPLGKLVAPGGIELRSAQLLRVFCGKRQPDAAVRPFQAAASRRPLRALVTWRHAQYARRPLDHDLAHVVFGFTDQRNIEAG